MGDCNESHGHAGARLWRGICQRLHVWRRLRTGAGCTEHDRRLLVELGDNLLGTRLSLLIGPVAKRANVFFYLMHHSGSGSRVSLATYFVLSGLVHSLARGARSLTHVMRRKTTFPSAPCLLLGWLVGLCPRVWRTRLRRLCAEKWDAWG